MWQRNQEHDPAYKYDMTYNAIAHNNIVVAKNNILRYNGTGTLSTPTKLVKQ